MNSDLLRIFYDYYDLAKIYYEMKAEPQTKKTKIRIPRKPLSPKEKKAKRKIAQASKKKNRR